MWDPCNFSAEIRAQTMLLSATTSIAHFLRKKNLHYYYYNAYHLTLNTFE